MRMHRLITYVFVVLLLVAPIAICDDSQLSVAKGPLGVYVHDYTEKDFNRVLIEISYAGKQTKPARSWQISTNEGPADDVAITTHLREGVYYGRRGG